jgi:hypothetical protein
VASGARQSHFEDEDYVIGAPVDTPSNPSLIRRSGSFNSIATGSRTVSAGATRMSHASGVPGVPDPKWALYSPAQARPGPHAAGTARRGEDAAGRGFGDENPVLQGVTAAGTLSGSLVRLRGTSAGGAAGGAATAQCLRKGGPEAGVTSAPAAS